MTPGYKVTDPDLRRIWSALVSQVSSTGIGITKGAELFQAAGLLLSSEGYWAPLLAAANREFVAFSKEERLRSIRILASRLCAVSSEVAESVTKLLHDHGFELIDGSFVPIGFFDEREAHFLPEASAADLSTAISRLLGGDLDGALTSECGAVDTASAQIYKIKNLGDPNQHSFQQRAIRAVMAAGRIEELESQLIAIGWSEKDAKTLCDNLSKGVGHFAFVMQSLRSKMGDVHGAKPIVESIVFDCQKIAAVILSLMKLT